MSDGPFKDLGRGRRKNMRRDFHYSAKLVGPDTKWNAFIIDISDSGAQLEVLNPQEIPDQFSLLIGGQSAVNRVCHVVWRSDTRVGVKFVRQSEQATRTPNSAFWAAQGRRRPS